MGRKYKFQDQSKLYFVSFATVYFVKEGYNIELSDNKMIEQHLDYLHMNPVVAGFVNEPLYWKYSSAVDYSGGQCLLNICLLSKGTSGRLRQRVHKV